MRMVWTRVVGRMKRCQKILVSLGGTSEMQRQGHERGKREREKERGGMAAVGSSDSSGSSGTAVARTVTVTKVRPASLVVGSWLGSGGSSKRKCK